MGANKLEFDEGSLREFFSSQVEAGSFVLEAIGSGATLVIQMHDGSTLEVSQQEQALSFLSKFFGYES